MTLSYAGSGAVHSQPFQFFALDRVGAIFAGGTALSTRCGDAGRGATAIIVSIYKPLFERAVSDNDVTHTVRSKTASKPTPEPTVQGAADPDLVRLRKAKPIDHLLPMCTHWLRSLPDEVRPLALAKRYPRIANLLALDWSKPAICRRYFDDLLIDTRRGNRQGFPLDVHRELEKLRAYYDSQYPAP
jgi:hypothetical protein